MSTETDRSKLTVEGLATRFHGELVPLTNTFSYFTTLPIAEEDLKQYLHEPIAALPPAVCALLPPIGIMLVPYLEKGNGRSGDLVAFEKPSEARQLVASRVSMEKLEILAFAVKEEEIADYHYTFYNAVAVVVSENWPPETQERFFSPVARGIEYRRAR